MMIKDSKSRSFLNKVLLCLLVSLAGIQTAFAIEEPYINELKGTQVVAGSFFTVSDEKFGNSTAWSSIHQNISVNDLVSFEINFDTSIYFYNQPFSCTVNFKIYIYNNPADSSLITDSVTHNNISLEVKYDTVTGRPYKGIALYKFKGAHKFRIKILSITSPQLNPIPAIFRLKGQVIVDREYNFQNTGADTSRFSIINGNQLKLEWIPSRYPGAQFFDLEYMHIDDSSAIAASIRNYLTYTTDSAYTVPVDSLDKWFRNNSTRVTTSASSYLIDVPYNAGFLLYRLRGGLIHYLDGVRWEGNWNYNARPATLTLTSGVPNGIVHVIGHEPNLNWQYSVVFAEEGKNKKVMSYFDGTLHNRQSVTISNSDNKTIVQETIYDVLGRPSLNILPVPANDSTIHYFRNFNRNAAGDPYSFADYSSTLGCTTDTVPMSNASGAAQYYSENNPFLNNFYYAKYIPRADNYPFTVTEYISDNTGRISMQGGVGPTFQINSGHETKYFYGKPLQVELDRLFGIEAGNFSHYLKNMVVDPNGQISVSYIEPGGKTIATALAGAVPDKMHPLSSSAGASTQISDDLIQPDDFSPNSSNYSLSATSAFLAPVTGTYVLKYKVDPLKLEILYGPDKDSVICNTCYYNLDIIVKDNCNNTIRQETRSAGTIFDTSCSASVNIEDTIGVNIQKIGEYYVTYSLKISRDALDYYDSVHLVKNSDIRIYNSFLLDELKETDFTGCYNNCQTCLDDLGAKEEFFSKFKLLYTTDSVSFGIDDSLYTLSLYDSLLAHCQSIQADCHQSICDEKLAMLKLDVSPGGQYALYDSLNNLLEPTINVLAKRSQIEYFPDGFGGRDSIMLHTPEGEDSIRVDVKDLNDSLFLSNWKDVWADSLVRLHPEYCYYLWCIANSSSFEFDKAIENLEDADSAIAIDWFNPLNYKVLLDSDPFFNTINGITGKGAYLYDIMDDSLRLFSRSVVRLSQSDKNILEFINIILYCKTQCNGWDSCAMPSDSCRSLDREWFLYKNLYLNLKLKFYEKARRNDPDFAQCINCYIGKDMMSASGIKEECDQPKLGDFTITRISAEKYILSYKFGSLQSTQHPYLLQLRRQWFGGSLSDTVLYRLAPGFMRDTIYLPAFANGPAYSIISINCTDRCRSEYGNQFPKNSTVPCSSDFSVSLAISAQDVCDDQIPPRITIKNLGPRTFSNVHLNILFKYVDDEGNELFDSYNVVMFQDDDTYSFDIPGCISNDLIRRRGLIAASENPSAHFIVTVTGYDYSGDNSGFEHSICTSTPCSEGIYAPYDRQHISYYIEYGNLAEGVFNAPSSYSNCQFYRVFKVKTNSNSSCTFYDVWVCTYDSTCTGGICPLDSTDFASQCNGNPNDSLFKDKVRRYPEYVNSTEFINSVLSNNPQQASNESAQQIVDECHSNCEDQADYWISTLRRCTTDSAKLVQLKSAFIAICTKGCSQDVPFGSSSVGAHLKIEAENWENMSGVLTESTSDEGGGLNVGWIDAADYMDFRVNIPVAGSYLFKFRVSTPSYHEQFQLRRTNGTVLGLVNIPYTGSYSNWQTVSTKLVLPKGSQIIRVYASTGGWNFNWFEVIGGLLVYKPIPSRVQAENYDSMSGIEIENTGDIDGEMNVSWIDNGDWVDYKINAPISGNYTVNLRIACPNNSQKLKLFKNGTNLLATVNIPNTGGWQTYQTISTTVALALGEQYITVQSTTANGWNFNWIEFVNGSAPSPSPFYFNFEEAIIGILGSGTVNDSCTSELLANPYPLGQQPFNLEKTVYETDSLICQKIEEHTTAWQNSGFTGSFHQYLIQKFAQSYQIDSLELDDLIKSCTQCNGILRNNISLPIIFEPDARPCLSCTDIQSGITSFDVKYVNLDTLNADYEILFTNYMNHRFGFSLAYEEYQNFIRNCGVAPSSTLCNHVTQEEFEADQTSNCMAELFATATTNAQNLYIVYIDSVRREFRNAYMTKCMNVQPVLNMSAELFEYHYTLYYYDQTGSLVKTVPPEGVKLLNEQELEDVKLFRQLQNEGCYQYSDSVKFDNNGSIQFGFPSTNNPFTVESRINLSSHADQVVFSQLDETATGSVSIPYVHRGYVVSVVNNKLRLAAYSYTSTTFLGVTTWLQKSAVANSELPLSSFLPLDKWKHIVVQYTGNIASPWKVVINGNPVSITYSVNDLNLFNNIAASSLVVGSSSVVHLSLPDKLRGTLKNLRIYNRILSIGEIRQNAYNNCQTPINNTALAFWAPLNSAPLNTVNELVAHNNGSLTGFTWQPFLGVFNDHRLATTYQYNSLNQVVQQYSPDGDTSLFWYDRLGRLTASQNKEQHVNASYSATANRFSYTKYDQQGRISEVGEKSGSVNDLRFVNMLDRDTTNQWIASGTDRQVTKTIYDEPLSYLQQSGTSRKRVTASIYLENAIDVEGDSTLYAYDILGNVKTLLQHVKALVEVDATNGKKRLDYNYDLVSGKVNSVAYQQGKGDQFFYKFLYDADNRVIRSLSSRDQLVWIEDASYNYYLHGPLARTELGQYKVQGIDFAYTLQGWIKGINSDALNESNDMANDGKSGTLFSRVSRDEFGYKLGYFDNEYKPIGGSTATAFDQHNYNSPGSFNATGNQLFNGNISYTTLALSKINSGLTTGYSYGYDQLNRLVEMRQHTVSGAWSNSNIVTAYSESIAYDANGNILKYLRKGANTTGNPLDMDSMNYKYNWDLDGRLVNNKLDHVRDAVSSSNYSVDIDDQPLHNYSYDHIGNLNRDVSEGLDTIHWSVYGKIRRIVKNRNSVNTIINYGYNVAGNRVTKKIESNDSLLTSFYIRDAMGNVMCVYYKKNDEDIIWDEQHLFGSQRLGMWRPNLQVPLSPPNAENNTAIQDSIMIGSRTYELSNYLGNVIATISDKKIGHDSSNQVDYYFAEVLSQNDYYPGGSPMAERTLQNMHYRYGFQNQEVESEFWNGAITFEYRVEDARLNRFFSVDPLSDKYPHNSTYAFAENRLIDGVELEGLEWEAYYGKNDVQKTKPLGYNWVGYNNDGTPKKGSVSSDIIIKGNFSYWYTSDPATRTGYLDIFTHKQEAIKRPEGSDESPLYNYQITIQQSQLAETIAWSKGNAWNKESRSNDVDLGATLKNSASDNFFFDRVKEKFGLNPPPTSITAVYPETLFIPIAPKGVGLFTKAEAIVAKADNFILNQTGGMKQWFRLGKSYSIEGQFRTVGLRWGASPKYLSKIGNTTFREWNKSFRKVAIPLKSWRTADPGHLHFWKLK